MARVENLLETLLVRVGGGGSQQRDSKSLLDSVETSPESSQSSPPIVAPATATPSADNTPLLSRFDNQVVRVIPWIKDVQFPLARAD